MVNKYIALFSFANIALRCFRSFALFNRYRAFRRASDMRCMLYVICCGMYILGQVDAILGVHWEDFGAAWVYLGAILGHVGAILVPPWGS